MMAPHNGLMNKPDNSFRRTVPVFPVVPAIPLSYTQRPVKKPTSTQPTVAPPVQNAVQETPISKITNGHHEIVNGNTARPEEVSSTADSPPSPAPVATPTAAPNSASEQSTNSSAISTPPTAVSAAHTRDASLNLGVAFSPILTPTYVHPLPATGPAPELPLHAPQSVMSNRPAFHQPHPSNGGSATGPYNHESNGNVHFGAAMQYQHAGYRPPPPQLGPLVSSGFDNWSPTRMNHPNHHGPPTPHSFHGSQASAPAEEHVYPHHPTANGQNGQSADPFQMPPPELDLAFQREQSLSFLREIGFNSTFHDCSIEIQFTPSNVEFIDHPEYAQQSFTTTISGHRVIFSRSPTLLDAMKAQSIAAGGCIRLGKIPDEYVRPDVFRYALGTFYAYDLDRPFPSSLTYRDYKDEFKTALCYIATARYLRLGWMEMAAAHRASMLLDWGTIESAVRFVALNATFSGRPLEGGILLITDTVVDWLARNFPLSFDIEITADDVGFRRLPFQLPPSRTSKTPAIANGSSAEAHSRQSSQSQVQMPRDARVSSNPRLSKISFGEIASSETKPPSPSLFPNTGYSQPRQPSSLKTHILSKILLHLPYKLLKPVLEHPLLAQPQGGYLAADRLAVVTKIIAAREAMRLQAVDKTNTEFRHYHSLLESASRDMAIRTMEDFWVNTMGFKEEVFMGDIPFLVPKWTAAETRSP